eukprot:m.73314 g.73314  ORF g.73314 m.73314 type:complete len:470 (-) comp14449_c0_seq2:167-1576(-)
MMENLSATHLLLPRSLPRSLLLARAGGKCRRGRRLLLLLHRSRSRSRIRRHRSLLLVRLGSASSRRLGLARQEEHRDDDKVADKEDAAPDLDRAPEGEQDKGQREVVEADAGHNKGNKVVGALTNGLEADGADGVANLARGLRVQSSADEREEVARVQAVPDGAEEHGQVHGLRAVVHDIAQPFLRLDVPVVKDGLEAGGKLNLGHNDVGDLVPLGIAALVVAVEAKAGGVVGAVSQDPSKVVLHAHKDRAQPQVHQRVGQVARAVEVRVLQGGQGQREAEGRRHLGDANAEECAENLLDADAKGAGCLAILVGALDERAVVGEKVHRAGKVAREEEDVAEELQQAWRLGGGILLLHLVELGIALALALAVVDAEGQERQLLCQEHLRTGDVQDVLAVREDLAVEVAGHHVAHNKDEDDLVDGGRVAKDLEHDKDDQRRDDRVEDEDAEAKDAKGEAHDDAVDVAQSRR